MARTRDVLDDLAEWYSGPESSAAVEDGASGPQSLFGGLPEVGLRSAVRRGVIRIAEAFLVWHDRVRERHALGELSDDMLRDLGISRAEAEGEAAKPFWRS